MSKFKFKLNRAGVRELLRSPEMMAVCNGYAQSAMQALGDGYEISTHTGKNRVNAQIAARTYAAKKENAENNTILKAIGGGG
ncbi:MAG: hypothetical protein IJ201_00185 [Solobacterium sp.]|nr:hypothetical protein [Solobacterium sp.]